MDIFAHALYGTALCSRTGLAGGRNGPPISRWHHDPTFWLAALFGLMPDILSMWIPFIIHTAAGHPGNFFVNYDGIWIEIYRQAHSLLISLGFSALIFLLWRRAFVPSLAWTVHILCDAISHNAGKYQTLLFYPLSNWGIDGIPFWRYPWFMAAYWVALILIWAGVAHWRKKSDRNTGSSKTA